MSNFTKSDGAKIKITFDRPLTNAFGVIKGYEFRTPSGAVSAYSTYSTSYPVNNLTDGSTTTYWQTSNFTECWIKVAYEEAKVVSGFRWYIGNTSYCPTGMQFQGSNNGTDWTDIGSALAGTATTGWQEYSIENTTAYLYYRINITAHNSTSYLMIYELQMRESYSIEKNFKITIPEYDMVPEGTLSNVEKKVKKVSGLTSIDDKITLDTGVLTNVMVSRSVIMTLGVNDG